MKTVLDSTTHKCSHEQIQFASTVAVKTENSESLYKKKITLFSSDSIGCLHIIYQDIYDAFSYFSVFEAHANNDAKCCS